MDEKFITVQCQNCKAQLHIDAYDERAQCPFCDTIYMVQRAGNTIALKIVECLEQIDKSSSETADELQAIRPERDSGFPPVQVICPRCHRGDLCPPVPSFTQLTCRHCKREFAVCIGTLEGGNRATIPGWVIGSVHEEFRARIAGLDGQRYHFHFELPGVGFDVAGGGWFNYGLK